MAQDIQAKQAKVGPDAVFLPRNTNQALGIGQYALDFLAGKLGKGPSEAVLLRTEQFHTDSVLCGLSALALRTNAPHVLRDEALEYPRANGACVFGSPTRVAPEKAVVANSSAVREWDSNGTNFGYNKKLGHFAGEFGHNDFYPVVIAACSVRGLDGRQALLGMICLDEIRGRLAEVFALKNYRIDHVVHGAIASAAVYGALLGATAEQIESAIGMTVAHYIPWRAIRAGHQLSDSKGASAALSSEVAVLSAQRALRGFQGPRDIFRNPESVFRQFVKTQGDTSPFDLALSHSGDDFAVMGMHFKLGLYEHQSAGGLQGLIDLLTKNPQLLQSPERIRSIRVLAYQPAFGIIGDPEKRDPHTRQSADHSMVYIMASKLHKALRLGKKLSLNNNEAWKQLMLTPEDYGGKALFDPLTRSLMAKIEFEHGGKQYDDNYPDGIPTSVVITDVDGVRYDSGFVMYPAGHARNRTADLDGILNHKFAMLASYAVKDVGGLVGKLRQLQRKTPQEIAELYNTPINLAATSIDDQHVKAKL